MTENDNKKNYDNYECQKAKKNERGQMKECNEGHIHCIPSFYFSKDIISVTDDKVKIEEEAKGDIKYKITITYNYREESKPFEKNL